MAEVRQRREDISDYEPKKPVVEAFYKKNNDSSQTIKQCIMIVIAIGIKSWQPLAIAASKQDDGSYTYNKTAMVLLVEIVKLIFCSITFVIAYFQTEVHQRGGMTNLPFFQSLHFIVPSLLYGISNTLVYLSMSYINPALFHVFGNIRIITTGLLYKVIMGRKQSDVQWVALALLTIGAVMATPGFSDLSLLSESGAFLGFLFTMLMCLCSTSSSIYTEQMYKKNAELSIWYQNMVLYIYGIFVNGIFIIVNEPEVLLETGLFGGFDEYAYQVLFVQSAMGVSLSFIFKVSCTQYLDNIVYVISLTVSMLLTVILSSIMFEFQVTVPFMCALVIVTLAIYLHNRAKIIERFKLDEKELVF